jgi:Phage integrase family/Putative transposase
MASAISSSTSARLWLCHQDGKPLTQSAIEAALRFGCKRAGLRSIGSHVLRHTFCSHLAMRGAAPKAIQELVGHSTLTMTLRYMHLAPSAASSRMGARALRAASIFTPAFPSRRRTVRAASDYCARPPLSLERLSVLADGRVAYRIKNPRGKQTSKRTG